MVTTYSFSSAILRLKSFFLLPLSFLLALWLPSILLRSISALMTRVFFSTFVIFWAMVPSNSSAAVSKINVDPPSSFKSCDSQCKANTANN